MCAVLMKRLRWILCTPTHEVNALAAIFWIGILNLRVEGPELKEPADKDAFSDRTVYIAES